METLLKKYGTLCLIVTLLIACKDANSQQQEEEVVKEQQKEEVVIKEHNCVTTEQQGPVNQESFVCCHTEEMPEFPGGEGKLLQFIAENVRLPKCVTDAGVKGRCVVEFVVEKDGTVSDFKILRSLHKDCDAEAIRVLKTMPRWKPGMERGKPMRVKYQVPVEFRLSK